MNKKRSIGMAAAVVAFSSVAAVDSRVEFRECPKCDKRIKIDRAANKAYVNLSRLEGAERDAVAARAARLLDAAKIPAAKDPKIRPLMGWSSWNTFGVDISESIILETAQAIATNGLKDAGYLYVNIDDGFFYGHGEDGRLRFHPERFPNGMKPTVDGIHALGLKAGIYSDAGADTCGSMWGGSGTGGKDKGGIGAGLYGHDAADCQLHFVELGFDFIKVDYCGGSKLKLNEKVRYTEIANAIKATGRTDVRLNLCRWAFPGTWAADIAESWRTTKDIRANWKSVYDLIGENLYLSAYAKPGHYNDMDMLEVGQLKGAVKSIFGKHGDTGLTPEEEKTHFGIWCMLSSPLLIGCDARTIPESTKALITNPYLLGMNQNDLGLQAYVVSREGDACILVKDAGVKFGTARYVALYNGSDKEHEFTVRSADLDLGGIVDAFDLVEMADVGCFSDSVTVKVAPHSSKFYRFDAQRRLQRKVYEAECAFLTDYHELYDPVKAGIAFPAPFAAASGGMVVTNIGGRATNDLTWQDVKVDAAGEHVLTVAYVSEGNREFYLAVDGDKPQRVAVKSTAGKVATVDVRVRLAAGVHFVRLFNDNARIPMIDRMTVESVPPMMTPWGEKVTAENAWRGYPRPQMVRENWTNLNGHWDYAVTRVTDTPGRPSKWDGKILVPFAIESALSGVGRLLKPDEFLWYTRKIVCDPKPGERILLHFGGVDFRAMVFIGHTEVTDIPHEGGQNPFTIDITDYVKKGENELTVCVWDPTEDFVNSRGKQSFIPAGCFYTRVSGIWQTVWMETVPETHVESYKCTTDIDKGVVSFNFKIAGSDFDEEVEVEVFDGDKRIVSADEDGDKTLTVKMPKGFKLWSPESPNLYTFKVKCGKDAFSGYFGMRKFEKRKDANGFLRFFLNNEPCFVMGTLDQGWWPDGLLTPPSEEAMEYDVKVLKDCGYNTLRKHIKVEPQQYYAMCDRLGIMVIQDLPSGSGSPFDPIKAETVKRYHLQRMEMKEMMDDLQTFPSIVMWCPYNEGWTQSGEFLTHSMLDFVRRYDPTRLVNGPSGCWDWEGGHLLPKGWKWENRVLTKHKPLGECEAADTVDMHLYRGPAMFEANDRRISFLGEYGGLGHPVAGHLWKESKSGNWGYGGIEDTKTREGLEKTYLDLLEKIFGMAAKGLSGAIYTQTTDVEIEINGILTYDRKVLKFNPSVLREAHGKLIDAVRAMK